MDALLKEQARKRDADEQLLKDIESGIDASESSSRKRMPAWLPLSAAAAVAFGGAWWHYRGGNTAEEYAYHRVEVPETAPPRGDTPTPKGVATQEAAMARASESAVEESRFEDQAGAVPVPGAASGENLPFGQSGTKVDTDNIASRGPAKAATPELSVDPAADAPVPELSNHFRTDDAMDLEEEITSIVPPVPVTPGPASEAVPVPADGAVVPQRITGMIAPKEEAEGMMTGRSMNKATERKRSLMPRPPVVKPPSPGGLADGIVGGGGLGFNRDRYDQLVDQPWKSAMEDPLSTFSIDVDTASYTNLRRAIREGRPIQPDSVRIEECINYFDYRYEAPAGDRPFAVHTALATCPWEPDHLLARVAIKGREIEKNARPASNLTFLIDVSGSMQSPDKLQLLKRSMKNLVKSLDERDRVGIVVYAGTEGVVLPPTLLDEDGKKLAMSALSKLESGGSTNGGAGIKRAYQMALKNKIDGGVNRVILATDGDFNVGVTGQGELVDMVKTRASKGVFLTVLGFGTGNLNDALMEKISNDGNGNYFYLDSQKEGKRVLMSKLSGTLVTIAKDVKIQIEFNPGKVKGYRLIGYANRVLRNRDFNDDKVDAGEIGAGHTVTAFYEIVPDGVNMPSVGDVDALRYQRKPAPDQPEVELVDSDDWLTLKLRYKHPEGEKSKLIEKPVTGEPLDLSEADKDFQLAASVAMFGMKLRKFEELEDFSWKKIAKVGRPSLADDPQEQRSEFIKMLEGMDE